MTIFFKPKSSKRQHYNSSILKNTGCPKIFLHFSHIILPPYVWKKCRAILGHTVYPFPPRKLQFITQKINSYPYFHQTGWSILFVLSAAAPRKRNPNLSFLDLCLEFGKCSQAKNGQMGFVFVLGILFGKREVMVIRGVKSSSGHFGVFFVK